MDNCCNHKHDNKEHSSILFDIIGILLFCVAIFLKNEIVSEILYYLGYLFIGYKILINAIKKVFTKDIFDENFLMAIATLGAMLIHEHIEAVAVLLLYKIGEFLQDKATDNTKEKIKEATKLKISSANLILNEEIKVVSPEKLKQGDIILVKTGEKVPVDAILLDSEATLDTSSITGEAEPQKINKNDKVISSSVNIGPAIRLKVEKLYENSTVTKIIEMIENATSKKSKVEKFITKFSKIYTPIVVLLAIAILILLPTVFNVSFKAAIYRALNFLVISCPCALVISVPLSFFVGIGICSKKHILIKGTNYIDVLGNLDTVIFDKTGTITDGKFSVNKMVLLDNSYDEEMLTFYCAAVESMSNHFIAKAIVLYYTDKYNKKIDTTKIVSHKEISGKGIIAKIEDKNIILGNSKLLSEYKIPHKKIKEDGTVIFIAINNTVVGYLILKDNIKSDCENIVRDLKSLGIKKVCMLTGDREQFTKEINSKMNFDEIKAELLPQDKAEYIENLKNKNKINIAFIGDGINDGVALSTADVGISMANSSDLAIEASDVIFLNNNPNVLKDAIKMSRYTTYIAKQNIIFILIIKILFLIFSTFGALNMWVAVFGDVGVTLICILNSLRIYKYNLKK